ncbi:hypothetical protein DFQ28_006581 [Apophysomyces sp. BC1034]|nr:hypothetical protein DFQ30_003404 [Apophysomyces sp. BC1015]KAG0178560.1 hypothetical protein DFQ29_003278 [Apophysomyces sp. BC1021]KAG0194732.1 hypothetical protein DFQ28_006581 [Apophysomyces sp. BC1034]
MSKRSSARAPSAVSTRTEATESTNLGSRQRQSKRDEAIRKKLDQELSRKSKGHTRMRQTRKIAGTVSALRPAQALTVKENMLVIEAAQLMAAKRSDCVLVVAEDDHLSGIFTAKDLAYRVVAESLDARDTVVAQIMTKDPVCVTSDACATDALNLMVTRGFRHLPVCNEEGDIFGLLDITKCLYEALDKMERAYGSSRKLYDALEGVEREWTSSPVQLAQYLEMLRDRMSCPDLNTVLDGSAPAEVTVKANVRDIARMMKEYRTTAVLVTNRDGLAGIFTTKDVVLRVIAAGLNPATCSVVRVMTPNPDTATPQTTIMEALRRMNDGHYLNLPVLENNGTVIGMVDVLKLTYATLEQMNNIQGNDGEGPMWSRFWDSFAATDHTETDSQISDSMSHQTSSMNFHPPIQIISPEPSTSYSQLQGYSEILPNESASMVANNDEVFSSISSRPMSRLRNNEDDGTFAFKFTSLGGKTHRFVTVHDSYIQLLEAVRQKIIGEHIANVGHDHGGVEEEWLSISYLDDEDDKVLITSDSDVYDAVQLAQQLGQSRVKLFVHDSSMIENVIPIPVRPTTIAPVPDMREEVVERSRSRGSRRKRMSRSDLYEYEDEDEEKTGFPQEILLPAAIAFLGVVIIGVFALSRMGSRHRL